MAIFLVCLAATGLTSFVMADEHPPSELEPLAERELIADAQLRVKEAELRVLRLDIERATLQQELSQATSGEAGPVGHATYVHAIVPPRDQSPGYAMVSERGGPVRTAYVGDAVTPGVFLTHIDAQGRAKAGGDQEISLTVGAEVKP